MNISRIILATVVAASVACATRAQDASPESVVAEGSVAESMSVRDMIDKYLQGKGWTEGENQKASGNFFVSVGIGDIQAPLDHRNYIGSRVIAYDKAMLNAKEKMVEYLGQAARPGNFDAGCHVRHRGRHWRGCGPNGCFQGDLLCGQVS